MTNDPGKGRLQNKGPGIDSLGGLGVWNASTPPKTVECGVELGKNEFLSPIQTNRHALKKGFQYLNIHFKSRLQKDVKR